MQKDFAKKSIFWGVNFKLKIPYLRNEQDLKYDPPLKLKNNGGIASTTFLILGFFTRKLHFFHFWGHFSNAFSEVDIDF